MLMTTSKIITLVVCQRYFRIMEILRHCSIVGKQMGKRGQSECVGAKESKDAPLLGLEIWCWPEAGQTFRVRREEIEALRRGRGRERGPRIRIRWRPCYRRRGTRLNLRVSRTKTDRRWPVYSLSMLAPKDRISGKNSRLVFRLGHVTTTIKGSGRN